LEGTLALDFREALASYDGRQIRSWIQHAKLCGLGSLVRFALGRQNDLSTVLAAVETRWGNGQVEVQINLLKTISARCLAGLAFFCYAFAFFPTHHSLRLLSKGHHGLHQNGGRAQM
jgi:hypothetical protein